MPDALPFASLTLGAALGVGLAGELVRRRAVERGALRSRFARLVAPRRPHEPARRDAGVLHDGLVHAGLASLGRYSPLAAALALVSGSLGWLWLGPAGLLAPLALLALALASVRARAVRRRLALATQLSVFLGHVTRACEAGLTLPKAIEAALRDAQDPLREVFARLCGEMARGADLEDALCEFGDLYRVRELHVAALPILLHQRSGGDLARLLRLAVGALHERERTGRVLGALRLQTRQLAGALILLPLLFWLGAFTGAHGPWVAPIVWGCVLAGLAALWRMTRGV